DWGRPLRNRVPTRGSELICTDTKLLATISFGSLKPKSATWTVYSVSSRAGAARSPPAGAWLWGGVPKTVIAIVLGGAFATSTPAMLPPSVALLVAVPPLSWTLKVRPVTLPAPTPVASKVRLAAVRSARETGKPAAAWAVLIGLPLKLSAPPLGRPVMTTPARMLAGRSLGSVRPAKLAAPKVKVAPVPTEMALLAPSGASLTGLMLIVRRLASRSVFAPPLAVQPVHFV